MIAANPSARSAGSMRWLLFGVLILGVLSAQAGRGTLAYFTSSASSTANTFVSGSIELEVSNDNTTFADSVTGTITASSSSFKPGEKVYGPLGIRNTGTLPMTYGISYTAADTGTTPDGASAAPTQFLQLTIKKGASGAAAADCTDAKFGNTTFWETTNVVNATTLTTSGATLLADTARSLTAGGSELLCMKVEFLNSGSAGTENAAMGGTSTVAFTFSGRQ